MTARSGRHMIKSVLTNLGYQEGTYDLDEIYQRFLKLADRKGQVFDYDLETLMFFSHELEEETQFSLDNLSVISGGKNILPTAAVRLKIGKRTRTESGTGNGPVDAVFNCISRLTGIKFELFNFVISAKGSGMNAQGQVDVDLIYHNRHYHGKGISTDVIEASALSLISACNSIYRAKIIEDEKEH
ncbi:MAG: 2-isopropylmalate synthase, partial [Succinivibrio sp.]|nr:2-isopropylmalate synthase [Succinivibrio sp.]